MSESDDSTARKDLNLNAEHPNGRPAAWREAVFASPVSRIFVAAFVSGVVAAFLGFLLPRWLGVEDALTRSVYYVEWIHLGLLVNVLVAMANRGELSGSRRRELVKLAVLGCMGAAVVFLAVRPDFRVLADETNLLGSSLSLWLNGVYRNITEGYFYYDSFHIQSSVLDGRPALYPFLMALLHSAFGFNPEHAFVVNFFATAGLIALVFHIGTRLESRLYATVACLFLIGTPAFTVTATSAGYDVLNHVLLVLCLWLSLRQLEAPSPRRLELLALVAVAAAGCRYESILTAALPVGVVALFTARRTVFDRGAWRLVLVPLFYVPLVWQRHLVSATNGGEVLKDKPVFGFMHIKANLPHLSEFLLDWKMKNYPMVPAISTTALIGLGVLLWRLKGRWRTPKGLAGGMALVLVVGLGVVHLAYYLGDIRQVFLHRLGVLYATPLALLAAIPLVSFANSVRWRFGALAVAVAFCMHGLSRGGVNEQGRWLLLYREYKVALDYIQRLPRAGTLVVSDRPGMYASHMYGAINIATLNRRPNEIINNVKRHLYNDVIIEQKVNYEKPWLAEPALDKSIQTETLYEIQNDSRYFIRLSRLVLDKAFVGPKLSDAQ